MREVIADGWQETRRKKQLFQMKQEKMNERDMIRRRKKNERQRTCP